MLFTPNQSLGTVTRCPYMIVKMAVTAIALNSGQKETDSPFFYFLGCDISVPFCLLCENI